MPGILLIAKDTEKNVSIQVQQQNRKEERKLSSFLKQKEILYRPLHTYGIGKPWGASSRPGLHKPLSEHCQGNLPRRLQPLPQSGQRESDHLQEQVRLRIHCLSCHLAATSTTPTAASPCLQSSDLVTRAASPRLHLSQQHTQQPGDSPRLTSTFQIS